MTTHDPEQSEGTWQDGPCPHSTSSQTPEQTRVLAFITEEEERQEGVSGDEVERSRQGGGQAW